MNETVSPKRIINLTTFSGDCEPLIENPSHWSPGQLCYERASEDPPFPLTIKTFPLRQIRDRGRD